jgi:hypothetical protein
MNYQYYDYDDDDRIIPGFGFGRPGFGFGRPGFGRPGFGYGFRPRFGFGGFFPGLITGALISRPYYPTYPPYYPYY